jgi:polyhydroxyalkanoate synthesis repressor PhaR
MLALDAPLGKMVSFYLVTPLDKTDQSPKYERARRIIKRYSNRKLYDTRDSRYVTLLQIADMVRAGEDVQIIDNATKEDKTEVTLALIISEELKSQPRSVPLGTLRDLIHQRGEKLLTQLREGPIGRLIPGAVGDGKHEDAAPDSATAGGPPESGALSGPPDSAPISTHPETSRPLPETRPSGTSAEGARSESSFEQWRHAVDERIRSILPSFVGFSDLQKKIDQLGRRVTELEAELARRKP